MSPKKKKVKLTEDITESPSQKRSNESDSGSASKRSKCIKNPDDDIRARRRKNFIIACEQVSYKSYFDHRARLLLLYLPSCMKNSVCKHHDSKTSNVKEMSSKAEEAFMIDARTNMWSEALEVCSISITPDQYLSAKVLKEIVEIMLNAHEDEYAGHCMPELIDKCQQILMQNFSTHPPCLSKTLKKCYTTFLTSPLDLKEKTFTNRKMFEHDKGIVKYCMNRLEYELSLESKDESLVDIFENIPEDMKQSVKGMHWQKEKFEIYECLVRKERIDRLMAVLESLVELLQFDLAIWHSRYTNNLGTHIMRSHKPLMAHILWSNNILYTGAVNSNCRQILKLFVYLIHLRYPEAHIKTMTIWLNAITQTFYACETNSNSDYPNTGKYCETFAKEFYNIISVLPQDSILRVLEQIQPAFMRHLVGRRCFWMQTDKELNQISKPFSIEQNCIIKDVIDFIKNKEWMDCPEIDIQVPPTNTFFAKRNIKRKLKYLAQKCINWIPKENDETDYSYRKIEKSYESADGMDSYQIHTLFITLEAYLDAYSVQTFQDTLDSMNEQLSQIDGTNVLTHNFLPELSSYSVTEEFIKKYRSICQSLRELVILLQELKGEGELPAVLKVFQKIELLDVSS